MAQFRYLYYIWASITAIPAAQYIHNQNKVNCNIHMNANTKFFQDIRRIAPAINETNNLNCDNQIDTLVFKLSGFIHVEKASHKLSDKVEINLKNIRISKYPLEAESTKIANIKINILDFIESTVEISTAGLTFSNSLILSILLMLAALRSASKSMKVELSKIDAMILIALKDLNPKKRHSIKKVRDNIIKYHSLDISVNTSCESIVAAIKRLESLKSIEYDQEKDQIKLIEKITFR